MRRPAVVSRSLGEYKYGLFKGVFIDKQVPFVNWHDYVRIITYNVIPLTAHEPSKLGKLFLLPAGKSSNGTKRER